MFISIPSIEKTVKDSRHTIIDMSHCSRAETCVVQFLERKHEELSKAMSSACIFLAGIAPDSGLRADLRRGGLVCRYVREPTAIEVSENEAKNEGILTFETLDDGLEACRYISRGLS